MTKFDATDSQRITVSAIGALLVSAACVLGAVGPVRVAALPTATAYASAASSAPTLA